MKRKSAPATRAASKSTRTGKAAKVASAEPSPAKPAVKSPRSVVKPRRKRKVRLPEAKFAVGEVVRHRIFPFRGVIFDIDPVFANTDEWWMAIPEEMRPKKDQPFYHLLAENEETEYIAYVSEQNLLRDTSGAPVRHPQVPEYFVEDDNGRYLPVQFKMLN